jgi:hypothetical protein
LGMDHLDARAFADERISDRSAATTLLAPSGATMRRLSSHLSPRTLAPPRGTIRTWQRSPASGWWRSPASRSARSSRPALLRPNLFALTGVARRTCPGSRQQQAQRARTRGMRARTFDHTGRKHRAHSHSRLRSLRPPSVSPTRSSGVNRLPRANGPCARLSSTWEVLTTKCA